MNTVFLDTVGLIALWDEADQWHVAAQVVFVELLSARRNLVTTSLVLLECGNAASRRTYRTDVCALRQTLMDHHRLIEALPEEIERAWEDYRTGQASSAGIVDLVSFAVMRRLGIRQAFTNDQHFAVAGFEVLF